MSKFLNFVSLFLLFSTSSTHAITISPANGYLQAECLKVPNHEFIASLSDTIDIIRNVSGTLSNSGDSFDDCHLDSAINDCLDLLDSSVDGLIWSISASQNSKGKTNGTGDLRSDLRTWLSAALVNQDVCSDGFQGTSTQLTSLISTKLDQITSSIKQLLKNVHPEAAETKPKAIGKDQFPSWLGRDDQQSLSMDSVTPHVVVAADGTGNFTNIMDAVSSAPDYSLERYIIYVKRGVYKEYVSIGKRKWNLMMVGDGMGATIVTGNRNRVDGWTPFQSATFSVFGIGFIAKDITFENTAGPAKQQAIALLSDSDLSVFFRCEMKGYQDTLYTHSMRQFYRECRISGTVDFIFGYAAVVFQSCQIVAKQGGPNRISTIAAHGRTDPLKSTGYSFQFCNISGELDPLSDINRTYTFLGRPWRNFSRTVIMQSYLSDAISPEGWVEWSGDEYLDTLYYGEYMNYGPGAGVGQRVKWPGYHVLNTSEQADDFTVAQFLGGDMWLPFTGVNYTLGLEE